MPWIDVSKTEVVDYDFGEMTLVPVEGGGTDLIESAGIRGPAGVVVIASTDMFPPTGTPTGTVVYQYL